MQPDGEDQEKCPVLLCPWAAELHKSHQGPLDCKENLKKSLEVQHVRDNGLGSGVGGLMCTDGEEAAGEEGRITM